MYDYHDYFNEENRGQPYTQPGEELEDYLRLLDMELESYLEYKGMGSQQKLFSRGLVITESEMTSYFEMPPYYRERDISNPLLTSATEAALTYIRNRVEATKEAIRAFREISTENDFLPSEQDLLRIETICGYFKLNLTELMAVLMALAVTIDRRYERIFGFLQDNVQKGTPTNGLLFTLMSRITPREGSTGNIPVPLDEKMFDFFFIRQEDSDSLESSLILHSLARKLLLGLPVQDHAESDVYHLYEEPKNIPPFFDENAEELNYLLPKENTGSRGTTSGDNFHTVMVYLGNEDEETALHILYQYCASHGENLYVLDFRQLLKLNKEEQQFNLSSLWLRLKLNQGRLAIRILTEEFAESALKNEYQAKVRKILTEISRVCSPQYIFLFGQKEEPAELASMMIPCLRIPSPSVIMRTDIWTYFLTSEKGIRLSKDVNIPDLADYYEIAYGEIRHTVGHALATLRTRRGTTINRKLILESLRQLNQVDFSGLATYINPVYTWKDITITDAQKEVLQTACARCRLRNRIGEGWGLKQKSAYGNGISLLLYGPPGTGKTMAAQVIANELELPLYRVDISQISSKYIGETEKNLATIFKAASTANVILFFDEADSLFSKRTEVSDSHDKYANNETAFLLQKIEEYNGMSILATNYYNNFDDAFVRRITYAVHMQSPDKETRYNLWTTILPKTAKIEKNIDFRFLAEKFDLSGSNIKAILFNAAYMAGAEDCAIGPKHIVRAMEYEFNKLGKLVNSSDFGRYEIYLSTYDPSKAKPEKQTKPVRKKKAEA